ncbi:fibronectin type III domain-containing protein [Planomonospora venezuelensis]|uniref:Chitodextrinase n=1 Tax=Planomonospora venezuelensis TaxID=1999 RepID=A0A841D9W3_PLAVE|nr:fibronectin type III domain-containing protein [Planomonospora venezuelensis]MBB5967412.1 chitodextrinase [Planomonospora venezuelensis]
MTAHRQRARLAVVIAIVLATIAATVPAAQARSTQASTAALTTAGAPTRPPAPATPDSTLPAHQLSAAPGPLDNPLKGYATFYPGSNGTHGYPRSLAWSYFGLSEVMTDPANCGVYDWTILDQFLNDTAARGNHSNFWFYVEYPGGSGTHPANATPACLNGRVTMRHNAVWDTQSPDYDDPDLIAAFTGFIAALGARYDNDPRIGFIGLGLIGLWGEWHTWPYDEDTSGDSYPNYMPTDANAAQIVTAYDNAFSHTQLELRYPDAAGGAANTKDIGYADYSFCYREGSPLQGVSLPQSMGGANYAFLQLALNEGVENKWITNSIGGEVRPEIQSRLYDNWPNGNGGDVDNVKACIELQHATWQVSESSQNYSATDPKVAEGVRLMGYNLTVPTAYFKDSVTATSMKVGVKISNTGVAPFYYPWTVMLGLKDSAGNVVKTWDTPWDIRKAQPLKIRAFPDWNVGSDPTYLDFGWPEYFEAANLSLGGVADGGYQLVMQVRSPLETISASAKKLRFANATQNSDGWLGLGTVQVGTGGGSDTQAPTVPANLASPAQTQNSISLSWNPSTDNVGVSGYEVRRGTQLVDTVTGTTFIDTGLAAGTAYTYTVKARDAAGNVSAASSALTVSTQSSGGSSGTSYEAEAAGNTFTGTVASAACTACSGGQRVDGVGYWSNRLTINNVAGGTGGAKQVTIYYTSPDSRTADLIVNPPTGTTGSGTPVTFPATGGTGTVGSVTVTLPLAAGNNAIRIENMTGWAPNIDRIVVDGSSTPPVSGTTYEAEAAGNTFMGSAAATVCTPCSGGKRVDGIGYWSNRLTITNIASTTAGTRQVTIHYTSSESRTADLIVNPPTATTGTGTPVTFPATGGTSSLGSVTVTLPLAAGNNAIRIENMTGWAPNIDRITV